MKKSAFCDFLHWSIPDSDHDIWPGVGAPAEKWGAEQEDWSTGEETWHCPPWCPVAACCAFSSNYKTTKGFPGQLGLPGPFSVILPECRVLFSPCSTNLSWIHLPRDTIRLLSFTQSTADLWLILKSILSLSVLPLSHGPVLNLHTFALVCKRESACLMVNTLSETGSAETRAFKRKRRTLIFLFLGIVSLSVQGWGFPRKYQSMRFD